MAFDIDPFDNDARRRLLEDDDTEAVRIINPDGASSFLLIGDHAGNAIPKRLGTLGIEPVDIARHIGWDIGVGALGAALSQAIDATFVRQTYSRLVVDCNRAPGAPDAIAPVSDGTAVPGNRDLSEEAAAARYAAIHAPYHTAIAAELDRRDAAARETILVALHSFTPAMASGAPRPWPIGILHDAGETDFALACLAALRRAGDLIVGDNEPYRMDTIDYTIPRHAYPARRRYVEIEIRQDLLADDAGIAAWTDRVAAMLDDARASIGA